MENWDISKNSSIWKFPDARFAIQVYKFFCFESQTKSQGMLFLRPSMKKSSIKIYSEEDLVFFQKKLMPAC
jgi:hypothetical protein